MKKIIATVFILSVITLSGIYASHSSLTTNKTETFATEFPKIKIPNAYTLHLGETLELRPIATTGCGEMCGRDPSSITLSRIADNTAFFTFEDLYSLERNKKLKLGETTNTRGILAYSLTNLTATEATLSIYAIQESFKGALGMSGNYGKAPVTIQFKAWPFSGNFHLDFGDGSSAILRQCALRAGHCIEPVGMAHTYTIPGYYTVKLLDQDKNDLSDWDMTVIREHVGLVGTSPGLTDREHIFGTTILPDMHENYILDFGDGQSEKIDYCATKEPECNSPIRTKPYQLYIKHTYMNSGVYAFSFKDSRGFECQKGHVASVLTEEELIDSWQKIVATEIPLGTAKKIVEEWVNVNAPNNHPLSEGRHQYGLHGELHYISKTKVCTFYYEVKFNENNVSESQRIYLGACWPRP